MHVLAPFISEINFMKIFGQEVAIFQPELGPEVLKIAYFGPSDLRNKFYEDF